MTTIEEIKENIQHWNEIRNESTSYDLLNSGLGVMLSRTEFERESALIRSTSLKM